MTMPGLPAESRGRGHRADPHDFSASSTDIGPRRWRWSVYPTVLAGEDVSCSLDPARGKAGVAQARRLVTEFGVRGFKFHPSMQVFYPNDRAVYPLYAAIEELGVPVVFHTGQTGIGAGTPGGAASG